MSRFIRQKYKCLIAALLIVSLTIALGVGLRGSFIRNRHREAENILFYYSQKILLQMTGSMNAVSYTHLDVYKRQAESLKDIATIDKPSKVEGRSMVMFLTAKK